MTRFKDELCQKMQKGSVKKKEAKSIMEQGRSASKTAALLSDNSVLLSESSEFK